MQVIFAGLEWSHFTNFESGSLTLTSVVLILPLGTLAAQRMANVSTFALSSGDSNIHYNGLRTNTTTSMKPIKTTSFGASRATTAVNASVFSRCEAGMSSRDRINPIDMEMDKFHPDIEAGTRQIQVERGMYQHEERI